MEKRGGGDEGQVVVPDQADAGPTRIDDGDERSHPRPYCTTPGKFHTHLMDLETISHKINRKFEHWTRLENPDIPAETDRVVRALHWTRMSKGIPSAEEFILHASREIERRRQRGEVRHGSQLTNTFVEEMTQLLKDKDGVVEELRKIFPQFLLYA